MVGLFNGELEWALYSHIARLRDWCASPWDVVENNGGMILRNPGTKIPLTDALTIHQFARESSVQEEGSELPFLTRNMVRVSCPQTHASETDWTNTSLYQMVQSRSLLHRLACRLENPSLAKIARSFPCKLPGMAAVFRCMILRP